MCNVRKNSLIPFDLFWGTTQYATNKKLAATRNNCGAFGRNLHQWLHYIGIFGNLQEITSGNWQQSYLVLILATIEKNVATNTCSKYLNMHLIPYSQFSNMHNPLHLTQVHCSREVSFHRGKSKKLFWYLWVRAKSCLIISVIKVN